jgi:hypothetical protein
VPQLPAFNGSGYLINSENTIIIFFVTIYNFDLQGPLCIINLEFWNILKKNLFKKIIDFLSGIRVKNEQPRPLLTFDIPQTALVATLNTYDLIVSGLAAVVLGEIASLVNIDPCAMCLQSCANKVILAAAFRDRYNLL